MYIIVSINRNCILILEMYVELRGKGKRSGNDFTGYISQIIARSTIARQNSQ
jgi:hypothetical protein